MEAKAALDGAVAERLADGGSVVYVDHDPARLAHLDAERWRIDHGEAVRLATGAAAAPGPAGDGQAGPTVEIEVIGCPDGVIGQLPDLLSVRRDGDRAFVAVLASASDPTLRRLLAAGDGVHIRHVDYRAEYGIDRDGGPR